MNYEEAKRLVEFLGVHEQLGPHGQGWGIEQNPHELATFITSIPTPRTVLEIGTGYRAGMARFLSEALSASVVTVDINPPQTPAAQARQIVGDSQEVLGKVAGEYDLVIIDADHSYEGVKRDYGLYGAMGKVVMFHDIAGLRQCEGVAQFWNEISRGKTKSGRVSKRMKKGYFEVIDDSPQCAGIGWIVNDAK